MVGGAQHARDPTSELLRAVDVEQGIDEQPRDPAGDRAERNDGGLRRLVRLEPGDDEGRQIGVERTGE